MTPESKQSWSMADVSGKPVSRRVAVASGRIVIGVEARQLLQAGKLPKGDPLAMAEVAGILAAKQTPLLLPLCHPVALNRVRIHSLLRPDEQAVDVYCAAEI
ncbi:MAG: cyclic pyranopterin monophosphate synthase MoaC, partial [Lysobacterales bacterium]